MAIVRVHYVTTGSNTEETLIDTDQIATHWTNGAGNEKHIRMSSGDTLKLKQADNADFWSWHSTQIIYSSI